MNELCESSCRVWGSNPRPPAYEAGPLTTTPNCSRQNAIRTQTTNANDMYKHPISAPLPENLSRLYAFCRWAIDDILMWLVMVK